MPDLAVLFRFNCRLADDQIAGLLPQSGVGNNRVYLAPYPADKWQTVWLQSGHAEALQQAAKCPQQCGLVRNRTGYGLRVLVGEFAKVYKEVFPSREVPCTVKGPLAKLKPLPGVTMPVLQNWMDGQGWTARPLKMLDSVTWLVTMSELPKSPFLYFGDSQILIKEVSRRGEPAKSLVVAGKPA